TIGVATLTGLLLASRWLTDLSAPLFGISVDRWGPQRMGTIYFISGGLALMLAAGSTSVTGLVGNVVLFYACAAGVGVVLHSMAGAGGGTAIARYVTASDLGSAVGPNIGWLVLQAGIVVQGVFLIGAGLYVLAGVTAAIAIVHRTHPPVEREMT
ncbi:MAG: hypothetical protein HN712_02115, partial [Gemmatimonadetes bacterium]|nr:hypothetical protein [Gemmatimonadota bacterium]